VARSVPTERARFADVRADFESDTLTDHAICEKHGLPHDRLWMLARSNNWKTGHRGNGLDRTILIRMLLGVLERQIGKVEKADMTELNEKETTVLGKLVSTLENLIEIEGRNNPAGSQQEETREMRELRNKLAKRIDRLKRA
jgi:hypothetical protein